MAVSGWRAELPNRKTVNSFPALGFRQESFEGAVAETAFAYAKVPFFRSRLKAASINPAEIRSPEDFRRLPSTRKVDYRVNFPHGVLASGKTLKEPLALVSQSSGTGGDRLTTIAHTYSLADRMRVTLSANPALRDALKACRRHRPARYAAPNCSDVECATPYTTIKDRTLPDGTLVLPVAHDLFATPEQMIRQAIDEVAVFKPQWFYADATHLAFLMRNMLRHGAVPPRVVAIALTYTLATKVARRQIREIHGTDVPMAEIVSMSELGWMAIECQAGQMHINNAKFYLEFLVGNRPARPGEPGELVVTSIGDRLLPHLRYRTGDVYRVSDVPCDCGGALPVARHEGRWQTMIRRPGRPLPDGVSPRDVDEAIGADLPIDVYRLQQHADLSCTLSYVPAARTGHSASEPATELHDRLIRLLGEDIRLRVESVTYIPSQRSGKFASCISEVPPRLVGQGDDNES
jgi:phenylacetate-CoA ligase